MVKLSAIVLMVLSLGKTQRTAPPQTKVEKKKEPQGRRTYLEVEQLPTR